MTPTDRVQEMIENASVLVAIGCTCAPGDGSGKCEREQACYVAWLDETARRRAGEGT